MCLCVCVCVCASVCVRGVNGCTCVQRCLTPMVQARVGTTLQALIIEFVLLSGGGKRTVTPRNRSILPNPMLST